MTALAVATPALPAMSENALDLVRRLEAANLELPQAPIATSHLIHGGMYARTIRIPAGTVLTGAFIKIPTALVFNGEATVFVGDDVLHLFGYQVIPASAGRKQVFVAHADTDLTMIFPTSAKTVAEAEAEFTDEAHLLLSRSQADQSHTTITGE